MSRSFGGLCFIRLDHINSKFSQLKTKITFKPPVVPFRGAAGEFMSTTVTKRPVVVFSLHNFLFMLSGYEWDREFRHPTPSKPGSGE